MHYIGFSDLQFNEIPIQCHTSLGTPYTRWCKTGMPRIPDKVLNTVFYLYSTEEDAKQGSNFGGTGFFLGFQSELYPDELTHYYAVSNWHNVCKHGASVMRVNTKTGSPDIFPYGPEEWHFHPEYDIAIIPFPFNPNLHHISTIMTDAFMVERKVEKFRLSLGDDVFMIGRFIDHDGGPTNRPAARFGNISIMPSPIEQPNGKTKDSYCIDLRSRSGYSGSPVFVYRTPGFDLEPPKDPNFTPVLFGTPNLFGFLGIHWGQFPEEWEIVDGPDAAEAKSLIVEGKYVKGLSGMTCVLPAWSILEVLNMPKLKQLRDNDNAIWKEKRKTLPSKPMAESAHSKEEANPAHKEDFTHLVSEAAK